MKPNNFLLIAIFVISLIYKTSGQNVGVGTTAPQSALDIRGTTQVKRASSGSAPHLKLIDSDNGDGYARIQFLSESNQTLNNWVLAARSNEGNDGDSRFNIYYSGDTNAGNFISLLGTGKVGINTTPSDRMHISAPAGENPFRVQVGGLTKLRTYSNGGTSIGVNNEPATPANGLYVSGNTGIGASNPADKLSVNGDINLTGQLKVNGTVGAPGQLLTNDGSGGMEWTDMCDFKNFKDFILTSASNWTVPAGVDQVLVEMWGAGGGGSLGGSGGAGGYLKAIVAVTSGGVLVVTPGDGGAGVSNGMTQSGGNGGNTTVTGTGINLIATGGSGASLTTPGNGGSIAYLTPLSILTRKGGNGMAPRYTYVTASGGVAIEETQGTGGHAAFTDQTGGIGELNIRNANNSSVILSSAGNDGLQPGGGGGGGNQSGNSGGDGYVILRW